jgi:hypothetical protein
MTMARHDDLIQFLEREAGVLRRHVQHLRERDMPAAGPRTEDAVESPMRATREEDEARLAEIEMHIKALRGET